MGHIARRHVLSVRCEFVVRAYPLRPGNLPRKLLLLPACPLGTHPQSATTLLKSLCRIVPGKCTRTTMSYYHCFMYCRVRCKSSNDSSHVLQLSSAIMGWIFLSSQEAHATRKVARLMPWAWNEFSSSFVMVTGEPQ